MIFLVKLAKGFAVIGGSDPLSSSNFLNQNDQSAELNYDLAVCWWKRNQAQAKAELDVQVESHIETCRHPRPELCR